MFALARQQIVFFPIILAAAVTPLGGARVDAAFTDVIDAPPASTDGLYRIGPGTQLNLYAGAVTTDYFEIADAAPGAPSPEPIEINLYGGEIGGELRTSGYWSTTANNVTVNMHSGAIHGDFVAANGALVSLNGGNVFGQLQATRGSFVALTGGAISGSIVATDGSLIQLSGGLVETGEDYRYAIFDFGAWRGSVFNMSGGVVQDRYLTEYFGVYEDSTANLSGGRIESRMAIGRSTVNVSGGSQGRYTVSDGRLSLLGGDFRLNGAPVAGLDQLGASVPLELTGDAVLTGTLADGTPITLSGAGVEGDDVATGTLALVAAPFPAAGAKTFSASRTDLPLGLRAGQRLIVGPGEFVAPNFDANWGSFVDVAGGEIAANFEATGAIVTISAGRVGRAFRALQQTIVNISGGSIDGELYAGRGSIVNVAGGDVGGSFNALSGSVVNIAGGMVQSNFSAHTGSTVTISGGEFRVNGVPVSGLSIAGATRQLDLPDGAVLSGTLADGRPFAMSQGNVDSFEAGMLKLKAAAIPAAGPSIVRVPGSAAPLGLRAGQTMVVDVGGSVGDNFTADWGSVVRINDGLVGDRFEAVGSFVNISGGQVGWGMTALYGTVANISGGSVGTLSSLRGSVVNISGGEITNGVQADQQGIVRITGGRVDGNSSAYGGAIQVSGGTVSDLSAFEGVLALSGGTIRGPVYAYQATVHVSGGNFGDGFTANNNSRVTISGRDFRINGVSVGDPDSSYPPVDVDLPAGAVLTGVFESGAPFAFTRSDGDYFEPGSLHLRNDPYYGQSTPQVLTLSDPRFNWGTLAGLQPGDTLHLNPRGAVGDSFTAGWQSTVDVAGGTIGENFEAAGAQVTISDGVVGPSMDAFFGSTVVIMGGMVGSDLEAHAGSVVNLRRGLVGGLVARAGSVVTIAGGEIGEFIDGAFYPRAIAAESGSEIHLVGTNFLINDQPIAGLEPGRTVTIDLSAAPDYFSYLSGTLLDGSTFESRFESSYSGNAFNWQYGGPPPLITVTILLTADFDGNGMVDGADAAAWRASFARNSAADADRNGATNGADLLAWQRQLGRRMATPAVFAPVPEPAGGAILAVGLCACVICERSCRGYRGRSQVDPCACASPQSTAVAPIVRGS